MKKLFISCPMRGRTDENIRHTIDRLHAIAEAAFNEDLEVIQSYDPEFYNAVEKADDIVNKSIYALGMSIEWLSIADYFIGISDWRIGPFHGCDIEQLTASKYNIPCFIVGNAELVMLDFADVDKTCEETVIDQ